MTAWLCVIALFLFATASPALSGMIKLPCAFDDGGTNSMQLLLSSSSGGHAPRPLAIALVRLGDRSMTDARRASPFH